MKKEKKQEIKEVKEASKKIIDNIIPVRNADGEAIYIDIVLEDGTSFPVPNTKSALLHYRNIMLEQTKDQKDNIKTTKNKHTACKVMTIVGVAGVALVNTTEFGKEIGPLVGSIVSGTVTIASGIGMFVSSKKLSKLQRNVTFACHKDEINRCVAENPHVYINVCAKDKNLIEKWRKVNGNEPIVIEKLYKLEPNTIQLIWQNICLYKHFEFEYKVGAQIEEPGFQKIKVKKDKKEEQSK